MAKKQNAVSPTRAEDFSEWYQQVVKASDIAENSAVRGCMIIKPHGYAIWEKIQRKLDIEFKRTGHKNVYFPLLIPLKYLQKEAEHVEGFAKECAVVTHKRLVQEDGKLVPSGELQEPYVIRPTSEMVIGESFSKWVNSYRDLPIKINQWANVMRWEMRPRIFLRTAEFLWQEGHTVHSTKEEAQEETMQMLDVYQRFAEDILAIPIIPGEKTINERFPGADNTYTIEAFMQDGKALQAGTSHFLGQNFAKAQNIKFVGKDEKEHFAWTTSWGVSTRLIGGLIMTHSDDDGLVLPPKATDIHIKIIPIARKEAEKALVDEYIEGLLRDLDGIPFEGGTVGVEVDQREIRGGEKYWDNIKKGFPILLEIGPRDVKEGKVFMTRRDLGAKEKKGKTKEEFVKGVSSILEDIQTNLFNRAKGRLDEGVVEISSREEFEKLYPKTKEENQSGPLKLALAYVDDNDDTQEILGDHQATIRCIPLSEKEGEEKDCIFTGKKVTRRVLLGKSY